MHYHSNEYLLRIRLNTCVIEKNLVSSFDMDWFGSSPYQLHMLREDPPLNQLNIETLISHNPKSDSNYLVILHCETPKHSLEVCYTLCNLFKLFLVNPSRISLV